VPDDLLAHVVLIVLGALGIGGVLRAASAASGGELPAVERRLGTTEWTIVLGSVKETSSLAIREEAASEPETVRV